MATVVTSLPAGGSSPSEESWALKHRESLLLALAIGVFAAYPFIDSWLGLGRLGSVGPMLIYVILAMGLNVVVGYAGLLDLGYAAFFAIGAYTMGFLTSPSSVFVQRGYVPTRCSTSGRRSRSRGWSRRSSASCSARRRCDCAVTTSRS